MSGGSRTDPRQLISVQHAAAVLDCSENHVRRLAAHGAFRTVEIRATGQQSKARIYLIDLHAYIDAATTRGTEKGG